MSSCFLNSYFTTCLSETLKQTHQGIMCKTEIKIAYIKKHAYKDREETTHIKISEEDTHTHTHIHIYIKDNNNECKNGHKTSVKEAKRSS